MKNLSKFKKAKVKIIAEIGPNHNGNFDIAKKMKVMPIFFREEYMCKENIGIFDVVKKDYLKLTKLGFDFQEIWCLFPCAPLINFLNTL